MKTKSRVAALTMLCGPVLVLVCATVVLTRREENTALRAIAENLRILEGAKESWALERGATNGSLPALEDLAPYLKHGQLKSVAGEVYAITSVGTLNTATVTRKLGGHWKAGSVLTVTSF